MQLCDREAADVLYSHANLSSPPLKFRLLVPFLKLLPNVRRMLQSPAFGHRYSPSLASDCYSSFRKALSTSRSLLPSLVTAGS